MLIELTFQLYEKQLKLHGVSGSLSPAGVARSLAKPPAPSLVTSVNKRLAPQPAGGATAGARLLDNCYSKTLIDTHSMKTVDIKEVILFSRVQDKIHFVKMLTAWPWLGMNGYMLCTLRRYKSRH